MDKKAARSLWNRINQQLPDFTLKNRLLVRVPVRSILCGVLFEPSAFSKIPFYIVFFVQPLYVNSTHLVLTFGERIPGSWDYDASNIDELGKRVLNAIGDHALPFFNSFGEPEMFFRNVPKQFSAENIHLHKDLAYTAIILGRIKEAADRLETVRRLVFNTDPSIPWPKAVLEETEALVNAALKNPSRARESLRQIELDTIKNLKLEDLPFTSDIRQG